MSQTGRFIVEHPPKKQTQRSIATDPLGVLQHASVALQHYAKCPMVVGVSHESTPIYDALVLEQFRAVAEGGQR